MKLTILRHLVAAGASLVVKFAAGHGLTLDPQEITAAMIAVYAVVEKSLKPVTEKMGEKQ